MGEVIDPPGTEIWIADEAVNIVENARKAMEARNDLMLRLSREWFSYDAMTGVVSWKKKPSQAVKIGQAAGKKQAKGRVTYIRIKIGGVEIHAHQVAVCLMEGRAPKGPIDHINGDGTDNRYANLREAGVSGNAKNKQLDKRNSTGMMGVRLHHGKWSARISSNNKQYHLGTFDTREEAAAARKAAEIAHGFHLNHGRK
ncbi:MAG: HNH endonuclease [Agrobacterium cavarae]